MSKQLDARKSRSRPRAPSVCKRHRSAGLPQSREHGLLPERSKRTLAAHFMSGLNRRLIALRLGGVASSFGSHDTSSRLQEASPVVKTYFYAA